MSISKVSSTDTLTSVRNNVFGATVIGALAGGGYTATKQNWLFKGMPSDSFVKTVSDGLKQDLTSDEIKENSKVERFLRSVVDPEVQTASLKPQIRDSVELSTAIKATPEESVEDAITRVFSQPKDKLKQDLLELQYKTVVDKKAGTNTARKIINDNFDAAAKKFVKGEQTTERMFNMIKSSAKTVQVKSVALAATLVGLACGAGALVMSNVPDVKA